MDKAITEELSSNLPDEEKLKLYRQALNHFQVNRQIIETEALEPPKVQIHVKQPTVEEQVVAAVPPKDKAKALQTLEDLKAYTSTTVDEKGQLVTDGSTAEDSNIADLIAYDIAKSKRGISEPLKWDHYSSVKPRGRTRERSGAWQRSKTKNDNGSIL